MIPESRELCSGLLDLDASRVDTCLDRARVSLKSQAELVDQVIVPALERIGDMWERGEAALSQVYMAGRMMERAVLDRPLEESPRASQGTLGVGVLEDQHTLGKRIIGMVLQAAGYDVRDLGSGLGPQELVDRVEAEQVDVLMVSVLMLNKALRVSLVREELQRRGLTGVRLIVGGAPFNHDPELWRRVGADEHGRGAADALRIAASKQGEAT